MLALSAPLALAAYPAYALIGVFTGNTPAMIVGGALLLFGSRGLGAIGLVVLDTDGRPAGFQNPSQEAMAQVGLSDVERRAIQQEMEAFNEDLRALAEDVGSKKLSEKEAAEWVAPLLEDRSAEFNHAMKKLAHRRLEK